MERGDEWMEDWIASLPVVNYVDMNLMPMGTIANFRSDAFQRSLDPENMMLSLRGVSCNLRKISDELIKYETKSSQWMRAHNPW